jgi:hypothetical protein
VFAASPYFSVLTTDVIGPETTTFSMINVASIPHFVPNCVPLIVQGDSDRQSSASWSLPDAAFTATANAGPLAKQVKPGGHGFAAPTKAKSTTAREKDRFIFNFGKISFGRRSDGVGGDLRMRGHFEFMLAA